MGKAKKYNDHHLIQKCDGGSNHSENIKRMKVHEHNGLHAFCGDTTLPLDKVGLMLETHVGVLQREVYADIQRVLQDWKKYGIEAYNPKCIKDIDKFNNKLLKIIK